MEEEAEGSGDGDEGLLKLLGDGVPDDAFDIRADFGVVIPPELG